MELGPTRDVGLSALIKEAKTTLKSATSCLFIAMRCTSPSSMAEHAKKLMEGLWAIWSESGMTPEGLKSEDAVKFLPTKEHLIAVMNLEIAGFFEAIGDFFDRFIEFARKFGAEGHLKIATDISLRSLVGKVGAT